MSEKLLISAGSNTDFKDLTSIELLRIAYQLIKEAGLNLSDASQIYRSEAIPKGGPDFRNAVFLGRSDWPAARILAALHSVEKQLGRERIERWGARTVDLDLLSLGGQIVPDKASWGHWKNLPFEQQMRATPAELILPHPRLQDRAFVLVPLAEIMPDWQHPILCQTAQQLCDALPSEALAGLAPEAPFFQKKS